jgi:hypothetical protein
VIKIRLAKELETKIINFFNVEEDIPKKVNNKMKNFKYFKKTIY